MLPHRAKVDLGTMTLKRYPAFPKAPTLLTVRKKKEKKVIVKIKENRKMKEKESYNEKKW